MNELAKQRIKFLMEHGEVHPDDAPASKPLLVKMVALLAFLQVVEIVVTLYK